MITECQFFFQIDPHVITARLEQAIFSFEQLFGWLLRILPCKTYSFCCHDTCSRVLFRSIRHARDVLYI